MLLIVGIVVVGYRDIYRSSIVAGIECRMTLGVAVGYRDRSCIDCTRDNNITSLCAVHDISRQLWYAGEVYLNIVSQRIIQTACIHSKHTVQIIAGFSSLRKATVVSACVFYRHCICTCK